MLLPPGDTKDPNTDAHFYSYSYSYSDADSHSHSHSDAYSNSYADGEEMPVQVCPQEEGYPNVPPLQAALQAYSLRLPQAQVL